MKATSTTRLSVAALFSLARLSSAWVRPVDLNFLEHYDPDDAHFDDSTALDLNDDVLDFTGPIDTAPFASPDDGQANSIGPLGSKVGLCKGLEPDQPDFVMTEVAFTPSPPHRGEDNHLWFKGTLTKPLGSQATLHWITQMRGRTLGKGQQAFCSHVAGGSCEVGEIEYNINVRIGRLAPTTIDLSAIFMVYDEDQRRISCANITGKLGKGDWEKQDG